MNAHIGWVPGVRLALLPYKRAPNGGNHRGADESGGFMAKRSRNENELQEQTIAECRAWLVRKFLYENQGTPDFPYSSERAESGAEMLIRDVKEILSGADSESTEADDGSLTRGQVSTAIEALGALLVRKMLRDTKLSIERMIQELRSIEARLLPTPIALSPLQALVSELRPRKGGTELEWEPLEVAKLAILGGYWPNLGASDVSRLTPGLVVKRVREAVEKSAGQL